MSWTEEEYAAWQRKNGKQEPGVIIVKTPKYRNNRDWEDGILWDSKKELKYYKELILLQKAKIISGFCRQCQFILCEGTGKENRAISYVADFVIFYPNGTFKIVDVKGMETEIFKQKEKMFKNKYPFLKLEIEK